MTNVERNPKSEPRKRSSFGRGIRDMRRNGFAWPRSFCVFRLFRGCPAHRFDSGQQPSQFGTRICFGFRPALREDFGFPLAFTLIELLLVLAIIALLAGLVLPALARAKEAGRGAACLSNLHQIGVALQLYVQENNNRLPFMRDKSLTLTNDLPSPDQVLSNHLGNPKVLQCPSDNHRLFDQTGSSYTWNNLLNGQDADHLKILGMNFNPHQIPLMFDKEKFHAARGPTRAQNFLYADGHIKNLLAIEGTIEPAQ